jgi:hypothetical protein
MRRINASCDLKFKALSWWLSEKPVLLNSTRRSRGKGGAKPDRIGSKREFHVDLRFSFSKSATQPFFQVAKSSFNNRMNASWMLLVLVLKSNQQMYQHT